MVEIKLREGDRILRARSRLQNLNPSGAAATRSPRPNKEGDLKSLVRQYQDEGRTLAGQGAKNNARGHRGFREEGAGPVEATVRWGTPPSR